MATSNCPWEWPTGVNREQKHHQVCPVVRSENTPGDITPTQHRKMLSQHTTPSFLSTPQLHRPKSTPCIATAANKIVKLKGKISPGPQATSIDTLITSHVGVNLLLLTPKDATVNPEHFKGTENQSSSSSYSRTPTPSADSTSDLPSPSQSPIPCSVSVSSHSSPHESREASPAFIPQQIHAAPEGNNPNDSVILFRPPKSRRGMLSRKAAVEVYPEEQQKSMEAYTEEWPDSKTPPTRRISQAKALHSTHLSRSFSEAELLCTRSDDQHMKKADSAEDVISAAKHKKGWRKFRFYSKPPSREISEESLEKKGGLLAFLTTKKSKTSRLKMNQESMSSLTIPAMKVEQHESELRPSQTLQCPLPLLSLDQPSPRGAKADPLASNSTESTLSNPKKSKLKLHNPKNVEQLVRLIYQKKYDPLGRDQVRDTPLHAIVRSDRRDKLELMLGLLVHSDFGCGDIDIPALYGYTALHIAVKKGDMLAAKTLLAFGADINALSEERKTPLDLLPAEDESSEKGLERNLLLNMLISLEAKHGNTVKRRLTLLPRLASISVDYPELQEQFDARASLSKSLKLVDYEEGKSLISLAQQLEFNLNSLYTQADLLDNPDTMFAIGIQQFELQHWRTTSSSPIQFEVQGGSRLLFLDGGGIRGLIQIEVLSILEKMTGRRIVDLFDWIIGNSTGGIVALALVYAKKSLEELRQMYFKLKEQIFASPRFGFAYNTEALEALLKDVLGSELRMCDVKTPKVLVSAVHKRTTKLDLRFFNNCFDDQYSNELVWKVARYTSAAPMYFSEMDNYVDGGVMANNPCEYGLTAIQNYHQSIGKKLDIAVVVSLGTGVYPEEGLGSTDAQKFLFFGKHWFNFEMLKKRATNLITLLTTALLDSESVAVNCRSRCQEQRIPYYRFSPSLESVIAPGETDDHKLIDMLTRTKLEANSKWTDQLDELVQLFHLVANMSKKQKLLQLRSQRKARIL